MDSIPPLDAMIQLRRLNGDKFSLHVMMIEQIQSFPDTTITLTNGKKIIVKNSEEEVISLINQLYKSIGLRLPSMKIGEHD